MSECVLDANVLVAAFDKADKKHIRAKELLERLEREGVDEFVVLDIIANEVVSVLAREFSKNERAADLPNFPAVIEHFQNVFDSSSIVWVAGEMQRLYDEVLELVVAAEARIGFNDALIVLLQREGRIGPVATFDQKLAAIDGFQTVPL